MINKISKVAPKKLPLATLQTQITQTLNPNWKLHTHKMTNSLLHRSFTFSNYEQTQAFLTQVSMRAHLYGHHPTVITTYNRVDVMLTTHDEGEGEVTEIDLKFAKRIDGMVDGLKLSGNETKSIGECHGGILAGILGLK